jgi:PAS domain S-box-containing protein
LAVLIIDRQGCAIGANEGLLRVTGYTREEVEGQSWAKVVEVDDSAQGRPDPFFRGMERTFLGWRLHKDGARVRAMFTVSPVIDRQREVTAMMVAISPVQSATSAATRLGTAEGVMPLARSIPRGPTDFADWRTRSGTGGARAIRATRSQ